jgi:hypothetical protein
MSRKKSFISALHASGAVNQESPPPPGRFLKRTGRANNARGLQGAVGRTNGSRSSRRRQAPGIAIGKIERDTAAVAVPECAVQSRVEIRVTGFCPIRNTPSNGASYAKLEVAEQQQYRPAAATAVPQDQQQQQQQ